MKYTLEELEAQVEGAIRTVRNISSKLEIERERSRHLLECLKSTQQAYHLLAGTFDGRHEAPHWLDCNESTCKIAQESLSLIENLNSESILRTDVH